MAGSDRRSRISPKAPAPSAAQCPRRPPHSAAVLPHNEKSPARCAETAKEIAAARRFDPQIGPFGLLTCVRCTILPAAREFWTFKITAALILRPAFILTVSEP